MRRFTKEEAERNFEELIDGVEEQGAFIVQIDGADAAVFLPPSGYAALIEPSPRPSGGDGRKAKE